MGLFQHLRARFDLQRFACNLNVFVPLFAYGMVLRTTLETFALMRAEHASIPASQFQSSYETPFPTWLLAGVLLAVWALIGLSPRTIAAGRERRHRQGQVLLGLVNLALFSTALLPLILANLTGIEAIGHLMWLGLPAIGLALWIWPFGLVMVWTSRGSGGAAATPVPVPGKSMVASTPAQSGPTAPRKSSRSLGGDGWRVGHQGRDCMYYEERIAGRWERLEISGEMLMGPAHHVIYFASPAQWADYPAWARLRRAEIIQRIKSAFRAPDYEYHGG